MITFLADVHFGVPVFTLLYSAYLVPLLIVAITAFILAVLAWGRRPIPGATIVAVLMLVVTEWTLAYAFELSTPSLVGKLFWTRLQYFGIVSLPLIWIVFVLRYGGWTQWARPRNILLASIIPVLTLCLLWTNEWHYLFYAGMQLDSSAGIPMLVITPGPWYWVNVAYGYSLSLFGVALGIYALTRAPRLFRAQSVVLLIGLLAPWTGNLLYMLGWTPVPHLDLTPFGFVITGVASLWGLLHYRLLDIMPMARAAVVEGMEHGVIVVDIHQRIVDANPATIRILGLSTNALLGRMIGEVLPMLLDLTDRIDADTVLELSGDVPTAARIYEISVSSLLGPKSQPAGWMVVLRDVTERRRVQDALCERETQYRQLFSSMSEGFALHEIICDDNGHPVDYRFLEVNPAFEALTGIKAEAVLHQTAREVLPAIEQEWIDRYGHVALTGEATHFVQEAEAVGRTYEVLAYSPRHGEFATVFMDITERMRAEERLNYLAYYDELTGLPNRFLLTDRLGRELAHAARRQGAVALLFLDLDRFKEVNDTLGHSMGDKLLRCVGVRLAECVRESDTVARMGGDEFLIMLTRLQNPPLDAEITALRLQAALSRPFTIDGQDLYISSSIGISIAPDDGDTVEALMSNADMAMYRAKDHGRDAYSFFSAEMGEMLAHRHMLAAELRKALDGGELFLAYQPQIDMVSRRIFGVEALLRWHHPRLGDVSPLQFIPVAEETGLIEPIGEWVLRSACAQMHAWRNKGFDVSVAVNLSARQFERRHIVETVRETLASTGLSPEALELEITESTAMQDIDYAIETLGELRDLGVRIAIDDFGTGHCSFGYLKRFPVSTLKIDRTFIRDIITDHNNAAIVQAIAVLGHALDLTLIAECVETIPQLHGLQAQGCQRFQGYLFSKPLLADECGQIMARSEEVVLTAAGM
jgi:diguanylate cyclase (GGDEF)-like protein/PAS domain S-box-containing protein